MERSTKSASAHTHDKHSATHTAPAHAASDSSALTPTTAAPPAAVTSGSNAPAASILTMLIGQATQNVAQATAALEQIETLLPGLVSLPESQRRITGGRLRDGEAQVLQTVLETCAARPELVASLADEDNGVDPTTFETDLLSSRIQLASLLSPLSASVTQLASSLDDTVLYLNAITREPVLEAYAILKAVAKTDMTVKTAISSALDYYSGMAKTAAATRKKNAAARLAASQPAATPVTEAPPAVTASAAVAK